MVVRFRHVLVPLAAVALCAAMVSSVSGGRSPVRVVIPAMASSAAATTSPVGVVTAGRAQGVSGEQPARATPATPAGVAINRPTMSMSDYKAAKAAAAAAATDGTGKPPATPTNAAPSADSAVGFQGINQSQSDGFFPPGVNGAV